MTLFIILYLLFIHWVADFLFQTTWMATNKYRDIGALVQHTLTYSIVMTLCMYPLLNNNIYSLLIFEIVTFVVHTAQDYITSKMTHKQFERKIYNGWNGAFTIIGLDQWLHFVQLFVTYSLLTH